MLSTGETVNVTNLDEESDGYQDQFTDSDDLATNGTNTDTMDFKGTFNVGTLYDMQTGSIITTDPTTGAVTTNSFQYVVDGTSNDRVEDDSSTSVTPANGSPVTTTSEEDSGQLQQAWTLINILTQTDASGNPSGTVTTTNDSGSDTEGTRATKV